MKPEKQKQTRLFPLVKKTDSKFKIYLYGHLCFFVQACCSLGILILFALTLKVFFRVHWIKSYASKSHIRLVLAICGFLLFVVAKYIITPLCIKIENLFGVKGADNIKNPNKDLL